MSYQTVGKAVPRVEGADKVTGKILFAADHTRPDTLWAKVLRSPIPHGRIVKVDGSRARKTPGVHAVLCGKDLPPLLTGLRMKDMPVLAQGRVRYVGEPVAAVAAENPDVAEEALGQIDVEYEEMEAVFDPLEAMGPGAPILHEDRSLFKNAPHVNVDLPNIQSIKVWKNGNLEAAFQDATWIFEHTFRTPLTHHGYLEPHACTVWVDPLGNVEIWASNKAPYGLRDRLAEEEAAIFLARRKSRQHQQGRMTAFSESGRSSDQSRDCLKGCLRPGAAGGGGERLAPKRVLTSSRMAFGISAGWIAPDPVDDSAL